MQQRAIDIQKVVAASVIAIGLGFSCGHARSDDTAQNTMIASSAADSGKARPIIVTAMTTGGLQRGNVMMITPGRTEILKPAQYAQQVSLSTGAAPRAAACNNF